jgi:hypothetical protein
MSGTEPPFYPDNWGEITEELRREAGECRNCGRPRDQVMLEVHHVVPVSRGGSHSEENLCVLCRDCHEAAHENEMAPVVEFFTGWKIPDQDFEVFRSYLRSTEMRPHGEDGYYIPLGDMREKVAADEETEMIRAADDDDVAASDD